MDIRTDYNTQGRGGMNTLKKISTVLLAFGIICFITSCYMNSGSAERQIISIPIAESSEPQPFIVNDHSSVHLIRLEHSAINMLWNKDWSSVHVEVMNENKETIFGFGDEFWRASGYDEGNWYETKDFSDIKITFPERGTYYLSAEIERSSNRISDNVYITIESKKGSSLPFQVAMVISFVACFLTFFFGASIDASEEA